MRVFRRRRSTEAGGTLLAALLVTVIVGFGLASYLILVSNQNRAVTQSMCWNTAVPVLEAGVEEALAHLHHAGLAALGTSGWTRAEDGCYERARTLGDGTTYLTRIQPLDPPVLYSTGIVPAPLAAVSVPLTPDAVRAAAMSDDYISRCVRVTTRRDPLFAKGMVAKGNIDLCGSRVETDSFDSENPLYSTGGQYDVIKRRDHGDVATNSGLIDSLDVGNAKIRGSVSTGPEGEVAIGSSGSVGDNMWVSSGRKGIQPGHSTDDMNVQFQDVLAPYGTGIIPGGDTVDGTNYNYVLGTGDYILSSLTGKTRIQGNATLLVTDSIALNGKDVIYIEPGASLKLYCAAATAIVGGNGVVNASGSAVNFQYYGLPSHTSLSFGGNGTFCGVIYAPEADFVLDGGGSSDTDFVGASITKTVKMNGQFRFHYDEALARIGPARGYIPISWNELKPLQGLTLAAVP